MKFLHLAAASLCLALVSPVTAQEQTRPKPAQMRQLAPIAAQAFYDRRDNAPVWADEARYDALLTAISGLAAHGLNPEHYHLSRLEAVKADRSAREKLATDAWLSAAAHMVYGKLDPLTVEPDWTVASRKVDLTAALDAALTSGKIATSLSDLAPKQPGYATLVAELAALNAQDLIAIAKTDSGPALRPGMSGARISQMQRRLAQLGLIEETQISGSYDAATEAAVRGFQSANGLDDDAIVGAATLATLNRDMSAQRDQIRVNLERWRWLPDDLGRRHVRANIADFNVTTYENGQPQRTHLTIVGKNYRKTPVFSDEIEYAVFNPWWETPSSLARRDKLPAFQKNPASVKQLGFQVLDGSGRLVDPSAINWNDYTAQSFPYRLRQAPGEVNALGQVKIIFPNRHNVYFHDTPQRGLFAQRQRAFSSGCMRTQDPIDLSEWLLAETPQWDRAAIDAALDSKRETRANLASPVPVHVLYMTTVPEADGSVRYLDDIYARDAAVLAGLKAAP